MTSSTRVVFRAIAAAMLGVLLAFMCACSNGTSSSPRVNKEETRKIGSVSYPVNENGQTYGSSVDAYQALPEDISPNEVIDYLPDLVLVSNEDGIEGYVLKEFFLPKMPNNPEEAMALAEESSKEKQKVDMYASDGVTVVGQWEATSISVN